MSLKTIDNNIRRIVVNAGKLNALIHETAMAIATHANEHGDCTRALTLVRAMPASMRRTMLVLWFNTFTPIRVVEKNDKVGMLKESQKGYTPFDLTGGNITPFYELAEQNPEGKVLDFAALVKLVESLGKRIEKKVEENMVNEADIPSAQAIVARIQTLRFERVAPANTNVEAPAPSAVAA